MSAGRRLILWNDERAVKFARRNGRSPVSAPAFRLLDGIGHWLDRHRLSRHGRAKTAQPAIFPCPECAAGKHDNCDGTSWDFGPADAPAPCPCSVGGHHA